jgi:hypothetical protein
MDTTLQQAQRLIDQNQAQGLGTQFAGSSYDVNKNTDTTVTPPMINSTNQVVIPPTPVDTTNYAAVTTSTASPYLQQAEARLTEASKGANIATADDTALRGSIKDLMGFNQNKATDLAQLEQDANINIQQKEIQGLTNEINQIAKETTAAKLALENQPYITVGVQGQQAKVDRDNAVKTLILNSALQAKQGNLSLALNQIQRSLDLKYKPKEDELAYKLKLLDLNRDSFTGAQKKQADAQAVLLSAQKEELALKRSDELATKEMYIKAATNGASQAVLNKIMDAKTPEEALVLAAPYAQSPKDKLELENIKLDIALRKEDIKYKARQTALLGEPTVTEKKAVDAALKEAKSSIPVMEDKVAAVDVLSTHPGFESRVGTTGLSRTGTGKLGTALAGAATGFAAGSVLPGFGNLIGAGVGLAAGLYAGAPSDISGSGQDFAGGVHKLTGGLTLQSLIDAKSRGATFGALSDSELKILSSSATALNDWEIKDDKGVGTGFWNIDEASFKKELKTIQDLTRKALVKSQGTMFNKDETAVLDSIYQTPVTAGQYFNN